FDLSVLPRRAGTDGFAKVELTLAPDQGSITNDSKTCIEVELSYAAWFNSFRAAVRAEAIALQQRIEQRLLSGQEKLDLASALASAALQTNDAKTQALFSALERRLEKSEAQ